MATRRGHAAGIPTRTNNMKLLTLTLAAAMVMAATGCETKQAKAARMDAKGLVRTPDGRWVPKGTRFFGSGHPMEAPPGGWAFDPTVFNQAMAQNYGNSGPQPVIVIGPDSPTITTANTSGGMTTVSTIGSRAPLFPARCYAPPIDTRGRPIYFTESIQQP
jgi:hypothetical protein